MGIKKWFRNFFSRRRSVAKREIKETGILNIIFCFIIWITLIWISVLSIINFNQGIYPFLFCILSFLFMVRSFLFLVSWARGYYSELLRVKRYLLYVVVLFGTTKVITCYTSYNNNVTGKYDQANHEIRLEFYFPNNEEIKFTSDKIEFSEPSQSITFPNQTITFSEGIDCLATKVGPSEAEKPIKMKSYSNKSDTNSNKIVSDPIGDLGYLDLNLKQNVDKNIIDIDGRIADGKEDMLVLEMARSTILGFAILGCLKDIVSDVLDMLDDILYMLNKILQKYLKRRNCCRAVSRHQTRRCYKHSCIHARVNIHRKEHRKSRS